MKMELTLQLAGLVQLSLVIPGLLMPGAVGLRKHVAMLPPFIRNLFWVYYAFIGLSLVGLYTASALYQPQGYIAAVLSARPLPTATNAARLGVPAPRATP